MNREKAEAFIATALADLDKCKTDDDVIAWDDAIQSKPAYLELAPELIAKLEQAYAEKVLWLCGAGAG